MTALLEYLDILLSDIDQAKTRFEKDGSWLGQCGHMEIRRTLLETPLFGNTEWCPEKRLETHLYTPEMVHYFFTVLLQVKCYCSIRVVDSSIRVSQSIGVVEYLYEREGLCF